MHMRIKQHSILFAILLVTLPNFVSAAENTIDKEKLRLAADLTALLRAAHLTLSDFQDLINDPQRGDKGLSGAVVADATRVNYEKATGRHLEKKGDTSEQGVAQSALMTAIQEVMTPVQSQINESGKGFKGFTPAMFARQVAERFNTMMHGRMVLKITAPKQYLRNPLNMPDEWENKMIETELRAANRRQGRPVAEEAAHDGKQAVRFLLPEYYTQACLACHGEPRGEPDITGTPREGGKLGELGGAISIVIYK